MGYPLIIKPLAGAGAAATYKRRPRRPIWSASSTSAGLAAGEPVAVEEFIEGHEGYLDTL